MDFTLKSYKSLLLAFQKAGYTFQRFEDFLQTPAEGRLVIMRHDVDELAGNALKIAELEHSLGVKSTFFFRIVRQSNVPEIIRKIASLGHEIGYHYEDLSTAQGDFEAAISSFQKNLEYFRQFYPVKTVCMHGSSFSKYDNRMLWQRYNLADFGVIGEPYLSINFDEFFYLTDTGYAWDGGKFATRDIVVNNHGLSFHKTSEIVACIEEGNFPKKSLILAHTLWSDSLWQWTFLHLREFFRNNIKYLSRNNKLISKLYNFAVKKYWGVK